MIRHISILVVAALALLAITHGVCQFTGNAIPTFTYETIIFVTFTTIVVLVYLQRVLKPEMFVQFYLLMMGVKLLAYGGYAYFFITTDAGHAVPNVVLFLVTYALFTTIEIVLLYRKINKSTT